MDTDQQEELLETIYKALQEAAPNITAIYTPQWNSRNDVAKTLLTIASAAIVITVSLPVPSTNPRLSSLVSWVLAGSWFTFLVSISSSIATLWISSKLNGLAPAIVTMRQELRRRISETPPRTVSEASEIVGSVLDDELMALEDWDKKAQKAHRIAFASLLIALVLLGIAGMLKALLQNN